MATGERLRGLRAGRVGAEPGVQPVVLGSRPQRQISPASRCQSVLREVRWASASAVRQSQDTRLNSQAEGPWA